MLRADKQIPYGFERREQRRTAGREILLATEDDNMTDDRAIRSPLPKHRSQMRHHGHIQSVSSTADRMRDELRGRDPRGAPIVHSTHSSMSRAQHGIIR